VRRLFLMARRRWVTPSAIAVAACISATLASAQGPRLDRIDVLDHGLYRTVRAGTGPTPQGAAVVVRGVEHVRSTTQIPASQDVQFGFRYRVVGDPNGGQLPLRLITRFPPPGLRDPRSGLTSSTEELVMATVGGSGFHAYELEYDWELVPGEWKFEIWERDRKVTERSFTVIPR
jgi:hypothetical protein